MIPSNFLEYEEERPFTKGDYEAVKQIAIRNGGTITNKEIFGVIMGGYWKLSEIRKQLVLDGIIPPPKRRPSPGDNL